MTSELLAAWVTASAAVIQAGGSIAAIIVAFWIARSAEVRAAEVERAALNCEEAARAASAAREEAAQKAAEDRVRRAEADHHNGIIDTADDMLRSATDELRARIMTLKTDQRLARQTNQGKFESAHLRNLKAAIPELKSKSRDMKIMGALLKLDIDVDRIVGSSNYNAPGPQAAEILQNTERQLISVRQELEALRID